MSQPTSDGAVDGEPQDVGAIRDLVVRVGVDMNQSGDAVGSIADTMSHIFTAQGVTDAEVIVFPTAVMVKTGTGADTGVQLGSNVGQSFRLDQVSALYSLIKTLISKPSEPAAVERELDAIAALPPTFSWPWRVFGHGVLTVGFALMLQPTVATVIVSFILGLLVGALKLVKLPTLQLIFPVMVSFIVTVIVLVAFTHFHFADPIRILVPPLVTFLPGGALTIGTIELATNQMMSGASRLVSGFVQLLLLAFGVVAATELVKAPLDTLQDNPAGTMATWIMLIAIPIYAVGIMLQYCAPLQCMPWILAVLVVAYLGQLIGTYFFGAQLSGFFGALAMTPLVLFIERLPKGPSKLITFLPAFWMLVPGSAGLMAVVGMSANDGVGALESVFVTIIAIALGVLIGVALFNTLDRSTRGLGAAMNRSAH